MDVLTHVPWGPVMMWGPTETAVHDLESGLTPNPGDVRFLLASANKSLARFPRPAARDTTPEMTHHREFRHAFVTPQWARDHEGCVTLEDYLRRRTSIAQWTPRMGLGRHGSNRESLRQLAEVFTSGPVEAEAMASAYEQQVRTHYDPLLAV